MNAKLGFTYKTEVPVMVTQGRFLSRCVLAKGLDVKDKILLWHFSKNEKQKQIKWHGKCSLNWFYHYESH